MTDAASLRAGSRAPHGDEAIAVPIPTPLFAPNRFERGECRICGRRPVPVLRVGGPRPGVALCEIHATAAWQQLTGAIISGVIVQPEAVQQRCSCWESPRHYVCQCSCHDGGGEQ